MVFVALLLFGWAERVFACSCAPQELREAVLNADYILIGTILSRQDTPPDPRGIVSSADPAYFEVNVERMLKGKQPSPAIVVTMRSDVSCGYPFKEGTRYIIFGYRWDPKKGIFGQPAGRIMSFTRLYYHLPLRPEEKRVGQARPEEIIGTNLCTRTTAKDVDAVAAQVEALLMGRPVTLSPVPSTPPWKSMARGQLPPEDYLTLQGYFKGMQKYNRSDFKGALQAWEQGLAWIPMQDYRPNKCIANQRQNQDTFHKMISSISKSINIIPQRHTNWYETSSKEASARSCHFRLKNRLFMAFNHKSHLYRQNRRRCEKRSISLMYSYNM